MAKDNHNQNVSPSIGKIGEPYFDDINDRIKFTSTRVYDSQQDLDQDISLVLEQRDDVKASRAFFRGVIEENLIVDPYLQEASIPLQSGFKGFSVDLIDPSNSTNSDISQLSSLLQESFD